MQPIHLEGVIKVRDLLDLSIGELMERFDNVLTMELQFDDGTINTVNGRKTILSSFYWNYHREFPELKLLEHHHIGDRMFGNGVHSQLISSPLWECFDQHICRDMDKLNRMAMIIFNDVFVFTGEELEEYVTTITVLDYVEIFNHPEIKRIKLEVKPSTASLARAFQQMEDVLLHCPTLRNNAISMALRSSIRGKLGQVKQQIGPLGLRTDYDSIIFPSAVMRGLAEGLIKLSDAAQESRSGTKALKATTEPLRKTEYFGRKVQLQNQYVKALVPGNCGTTHTVTFHVTKKSLGNLAGKYHLLDDGITLEEISEESKHLIGKPIKLRSPLACNHRHEYNVCETCAGTVSYSIPSSMYYRQATRLGHVSAIALCSFVSQKVMSTKHEDGSSVAEHLNIEARDAEYIKLNGADSSKIQFQKALKDQNTKLVIPEEYVKYLDDINNPDVTDVKILPTTTLAVMAEVVIRREVTTGKGKVEKVENIVPTSVGPRLASFTYDFLEYLKKYGWEVDSYGHYVIDLAHWTFSKPFLVMPQRHMNMLEYMQSISEFIEKKDRNGVYGCKTSAEALRKIYDIVNSRANVNILHLEILLMASMVTSAARANSAAPRVTGEEEEFNIHRENMFNRSAGGYMGFERHGDIITRASSYNNKNTPDHNFDNILRG